MDRKWRSPLALTAVFTLLLAMALPAIAEYSSNKVSYTGQGFTDDGRVESVKCGPDADYGQDEEAALLGDDTSGFYLKWVFTGSSATDVTLTGPWGEADMFQNARGTSAWMLVTPLYDLELLDGQVFASWEGDAGTNPQLTVSNGCDGAKVTIAKVTVDNREGDFDFETDLGEDFTLADGESESFFVARGDYSATEIVPQNWTLNSIVCDASDNVTTEVDVANATVDITVVGYDDVTCTFTNEEATGSILIEKTYSVDPGAGNFAEFTVTPGDIVMDRYPTDDPTLDLYCTDELSFGDYRVTETKFPEDFEELPVIIDVTVSTESTCTERLAAEGDDFFLDGGALNQASPAALDVFKFKLDWEDGEYVTTETPLNGFEFTLYGPEAEVLEVVTTTDVEVGDEVISGLAQFVDTELVIGQTYTVCETGVAPLANEFRPDPELFWSAPYMLDGEDLVLAKEGCQLVEPVLGDDIITKTFYNAPKADIAVIHFNQTGYTTMELVCEDGPIFTDAGGLSDNIREAVRANIVPMGDYECTIKIRNGGNG